MKYCSECGASVEQGAAYCSSCGSSLTGGAAKPSGFWLGVAAAIVGVGVIVGALWATMASNSGDLERGKPVASADENESESEATPDVSEMTSASEPSEPRENTESAESTESAKSAETKDVVVEEPGFVGRLLGEKPRVFVTLSEGESLPVELRETISTETARSGDRFTAVLTEPVLVEGREALPRGTIFTGHVAHAERSDKVKGRAQLTLELDSLELASGETQAVEAEPFRFEARSTQKDDAIKIGGASGVGAVVGGIIGGKKGAAIGAGVGAGAGTGVVLTTRGEEVVLPEGTALVTELRSEITVEVTENEEEREDS